MLRALRQLLAEWSEALRIALENLRAHKMRSLLTALGVIIGIIAVTLMGTAIRGIDQGFDESLDMLGKDLVYIERWPWADPGDNWVLYRNRAHIDLRDAERINQHIRNNPESFLRLAAPSSVTFRAVEHGDEIARGVFINGTDANFALMTPADMLVGRFFNYAEQMSRARVAVLGYDVANVLFDEAPETAVGQRVRIAGRPFSVIGVLDRQGSFLGMQSFDNQVIMPLSALRSFYSGNWRNSIRVQVVANAPMDLALDELTGVYRSIRELLPEEDNDFELNRSEVLEAQFAPIKAGIATAGFFITGLALFVGAIGIMNITFVSVKERTREIGTRRALGARKRAILTQFLIEAVAICLLGGLLGLLGAFGIKQAVAAAFPDFPFTFSSDLVVLAFVLSVFTGVASGLAPAHKAASLDPANALRHE